MIYTGYFLTEIIFCFSVKIRDGMLFKSIHKFKFKPNIQFRNQDSFVGWIL